VSKIRSTSNTRSEEYSQRIEFGKYPVIISADIVARETERINRSGFLEASFAIQGVECDMGKDQKLILFRIIQESLQNILKHANAQLIKIVFMYLPDKISINISGRWEGI